MLNPTCQIASAARWGGRLLAFALASISVTSPSHAQFEPLPPVASEFGQAAGSVTPATPGTPGLPGYSATAPAEPIWTPYGDATVRNDDGLAVDDECAPPTGFEGDPNEPWQFRLMPKSLIWHSYLAGPWEPRFGSVWSHDRREKWVWDVALGGRVSLLRYGTGDRAQPDGWELQMEGAAFPRLDPLSQVDLVSTDYRFGMPIIYGKGAYQMKIGIYHISSHLGDEYMLSHPNAERINFGRNAIAWGHSYYWTPNLRLYGEADWASDCQYSKPWYFQFGFDYAPILRAGNQCAPFVAVNCQLRQELDFSGQLVAQAGWAWRYGADRRMFRVGVQLYNGGNQQFEFYTKNEQKIGLGLWYDY